MFRQVSQALDQGFKPASLRARGASQLHAIGMEIFIAGPASVLYVTNYSEPAAKRRITGFVRTRQQISVPESRLKLQQAASLPRAFTC